MVVGGVVLIVVGSGDQLVPSGMMGHDWTPSWYPAAKLDTQLVPKMAQESRVQGVTQAQRYFGFVCLVFLPIS